jgi:hypothetical protein
VAFLFGDEEFLICMAVKSHMECKLTVALKTYPLFFFYFGLSFFLPIIKLCLMDFC